MARSLLILLCTGMFAALGLYLGYAIHGMTARAVIATCAGAAGGFGIGCVGTHVAALWQAQRQSALPQR